MNNKSKILIVDDVFINRGILSDIPSDEYDMIEAENGEEALEKINKYENERAEPDVKNLIILAEYFNTSIDYLVGYSDINHKVEELTEYSMSNSEIKVMEGYRSLESSNKVLVTSTIEALSGKVSD